MSTVSPHPSDADRPGAQPPEPTSGTVSTKSGERPEASPRGAPGDQGEQPWRAAETDNSEDFLLLLVVAEGVGCLMCAYSLVLLVLDGAASRRLMPFLIALLAASVALLATSAIADYRRHARHRAGKPQH